jgi:hypothetical protein
MEKNICSTGSQQFLLFEQILFEIVSTMEFAFTWGYRWRKPYAGMKDNEEVRILKFCMLNMILMEDQFCLIPFNVWNSSHPAALQGGNMHEWWSLMCPLFYCR